MLTQEKYDEMVRKKVEHRRKTSIASGWQTFSIKRAAEKDQTEYQKARKRKKYER